MSNAEARMANGQGCPGKDGCHGHAAVAVSRGHADGGASVIGGQDVVHHPPHRRCRRRIVRQHVGLGAAGQPRRGGSGWPGPYGPGRGRGCSERRAGHAHGTGRCSRWLDRPKRRPRPAIADPLQPHGKSRHPLRATKGTELSMVSPELPRTPGVPRTLVGVRGKACLSVNDLVGVLLVHHLPGVPWPSPQAIGDASGGVTGSHFGPEAGHSHQFSVYDQDLLVRILAEIDVRRSKSLGPAFFSPVAGPDFIEGEKGTTGVAHTGSDDLGIEGALDHIPVIGRLSVQGRLVFCVNVSHCTSRPSGQRIKPVPLGRSEEENGRRQGQGQGPENDEPRFPAPCHAELDAPKPERFQGHHTGGFRDTIPNSSRCHSHTAVVVPCPQGGVAVKAAAGVAPRRARGGPPKHRRAEAPGPAADHLLTHAGAGPPPSRARQTTA